jgi:hypothetical protein
MDLKPKRLVARMAHHHEAVIAARRAGLSWSEIGDLFGASGAATRKAHVRALAAMRAGKLVPLEQMPLPLPKSLGPSPATPAISSSAGKTGTERGQSNKDFLASLEHIGGKK